MDSRPVVGTQCVWPYSCAPHGAGSVKSHRTRHGTPTASTVSMLALVCGLPPDRELTAVRYLTHETEFLPVFWVLFNATFIERDQVKRCLLHLYSRDLVRRVPLPRAARRLASEELDAFEEGLTFVGRQVKCDVGRVDIVGRGGRRRGRRGRTEGRGGEGFGHRADRPLHGMAPATPHRKTARIAFTSRACPRRRRPPRR